MTLATSPRPRATPVRLGLIADPHLATEARGTWKVYHRSEPYLRRAVETLLDSDVDRVVVLGDLTKDGEPRNFDRFDEILADLSVPLECIPGNHDVPKAFDDHETLSAAALRRRHAPEGFPRTARVGGVTLVFLDSTGLAAGSLADTWGGAVSARQIEQLADVLADAPNPIVCAHHNLFALPEHDGAPWDNFPLRNGPELHGILAEHDVALFLSGHHHVPATQRTGGVREVIVPPLCSYPHAVGIVDVDPLGTRVELCPVATPSETADGYALATGDDPLGARIAEMAATRLDALPGVEP